MSLDLSIIIVNWNTCDLLRECLNSIAAFGGESETIVVDNGSADNSVTMVMEVFEGVRLLENGENIGFARAINIGIKASGRKYILLLNSDAQLTKGALERMINCLDGDERIGICGPQLVYPDGQFQESHGNLPQLGWEIWGLLGGIRKNTLRDGRSAKSKSLLPGSGVIYETGMVNGASMMIRRLLLDEVGMLDERFFMFNEEIDLCKRAWEVGWKVVFLPEAVVKHVGGGSTGVKAGRVLQLYKGKLQYFDKHMGKASCTILWCAMWLATWIKIIFYTILKIVGVEKQGKARMWLEVSKGLGSIREISG